jgi:hypothetical protein
MYYIKKKYNKKDEVFTELRKRCNIEHSVYCLPSFLGVAYHSFLHVGYKQYPMYRLKGLRISVYRILQDKNSYQQGTEKPFRFDKGLTLGVDYMKQQLGSKTTKF